MNKSETCSRCGDYKRTMIAELKKLKHAQTRDINTLELEFSCDINEFEFEIDGLWHSRKRAIDRLIALAQDEVIDKEAAK